jgi:hypothetical protein
MITGETEGRWARKEPGRGIAARGRQRRFAREQYALPLGEGEQTRTHKTRGKRGRTTLFWKRQRCLSSTGGGVWTSWDLLYVWASLRPSRQCRFPLAALRGRMVALVPGGGRRQNKAEPTRTNQNRAEIRLFGGKGCSSICPGKYGKKRVAMFKEIKPRDGKIKPERKKIKPKTPMIKPNLGKTDKKLNLKKLSLIKPMEAL